MRLWRGLALAAAVLSVSVRGGAGEKGGEQVSPFFGSFGYQVPIVVPPYHGLEPRLALGYSSEGRNGFVGVGWTLSGFSTIERVNAGRGTPRYDATDSYLLDGQQLLACVTGSTSPSCTTGSGERHFTKQESYLRIARDAGQDKWTVWGKDGTRTEFTALLGTASGTLRWGQSSTQDTKGNTVAYGWSCDGGATGDCYPASVSYGSGYAVTLYREDRPEDLSYGAVDRLRTTSKRLRSVAVSLGGATIRVYALGYTASAATGRSLLASVTQYGKGTTLDAGGGVVSGAATEIAKVRRVIQKAEPTGPHEVLLVLDANVGQNAIQQVKAFDKAIGVTGLIVTKLDGTAKGGVLAAIARQCPKPVRYIGVGEAIEDLQPFRVREFVAALFEPAARA